MLWHETTAGICQLQVRVASLHLSSFHYGGGQKLSHATQWCGMGQGSSYLYGILAHPDCLLIGRLTPSRNTMLSVSTIVNAPGSVASRPLSDVRGHCGWLWEGRGLRNAAAPKLPGPSHQ